MKLTKKQIDQRVDDWYLKNNHTLRCSSLLLKHGFKEALKHDLFLGQTLMRVKSTADQFKLASSTIMYKWADTLDIQIIVTTDAQNEQREKRNHNIIKLNQSGLDVPSIAKKIGISAQTVYTILATREKWEKIEHVKRLRPKNVAPVLKVINHLFIAQSVKTNPYGMAGY